VIIGDPVAGDLELVEVSMISDASPEQGPLYQVTLKNNSRINAEHFRVSIVAVLGEIAEDSPSVTVNVDGIGAGETATLQIQMPLTVMQLGPQGAEAVAFDTMVVAIDSFDELMESNEVNNVATFNRADVKLIEVTTTVTADESPAAVQQAPADEAPVMETPAEGAPANPSSPNPPATEDIDIDNLELDNADEAKELFTR
jgi:DNA gyrase inhibitor GyrI